MKVVSYAPGESVTVPVTPSRLDLCRQKGFDAVEPDMITGGAMQEAEGGHAGTSGKCREDRP